MRKNLTDGNLALAGFNDIFDLGKPEIGERIVEIPLAELFPPDFHPFQINDDAAMSRLTESVKKYGVRKPGIARPCESGSYELLCGNRRKRASERAGCPTMPTIVRELDDTSAMLVMIECNH